MPSVSERMKAFQAGGGLSSRCPPCGKIVYQADPQITLDGSKFHKACAKCKDCGCQITLANFTKCDDVLLCKTHYVKRFHTDGGYMEGESLMKSWMTKQNFETPGNDSNNNSKRSLAWSKPKLSSTLSNEAPVHPREEKALEASKALFVSEASLESPQDNVQVDNCKGSETLGHDGHSENHREMNESLKENSIMQSNLGYSANKDVDSADQKEGESREKELCQGESTTNCMNTAEPERTLTDKIHSHVGISATEEISAENSMGTRSADDELVDNSKNTKEEEMLQEQNNGEQDDKDNIKIVADTEANYLVSPVQHRQPPYDDNTSTNGHMADKKNEISWINDAASIVSDLSTPKNQANAANSHENKTCNLGDSSTDKAGHVSPSLDFLESKTAVCVVATSYESHTNNLQSITALPSFSQSTNKNKSTHEDNVEVNKTNVVAMGKKDRSKSSESLHLYVDCQRGISARSFLDGLRALARALGDDKADEALRVDSLSAAIWKEHIPSRDKEVLQYNVLVGEQEMPVQSWEPFWQAVLDSPPGTSEKVVSQLREILQMLEVFYHEGTAAVSPLFPSTIWHMMAVMILLDRMGIQDIYCSAVAQENNCLEAVQEILKEYPEAPRDPSDREFVTTLDGAILLKVLCPMPRLSQKMEFHGKATGWDASIKTKLRIGTPLQRLDDRVVISETESASKNQPGTETLTSKDPSSNEEEAKDLTSPLWNVESNLTLLETIITDMTPEHLGFCAELLLMQGSSEVWLTPAIAGKGLPGHQLHCLVQNDIAPNILTTMFRQTTAIAINVWLPSFGLRRVTLRHETITVEYCRRPIQVNVGYLGKDAISIKPHFDQCVQLSMDTKIPLVDVSDDVKAMAKDAQRRKILAMI